MAPRLKLPDNFRVKTFWSSRNSRGLGNFLPPTGGSGAGSLAIAPIEISSGVEDEVTHVSETQLSDSLSRPAQQRCPPETTIVSPEGANEGEGISTRRRRKRGAANTVASCASKKKKVAPSTVTRRWQAVWACKYTWAEGEFDANDNLAGVIYRSCSMISGRRKVIVAKGDNLEKHEGKRVCTEDGVPFPHLKKGDTFTKVDYKHLQYCKLWAARKQGGTVADQLVAGLEGELKRKGVQFSTLFQVLSHGRPMCDYKREQYLLRHLKVKNLPKKHWSETSGWEMSEHLHASVLSALKAVVQSARIISISADEVTAIDNTSWLGVHVYAMDSWERVPHLLHLSCVSDGGTMDHLTNVIMFSLLGEGGLSREEIALKLVCFGADGVSTFQGARKGVTAQIREKWAPFVLGASCASHRINLVVETLSNYPMVSRLEGVFQSIYAYFCRSHKRQSKLQKLADLMETKAKKMLRNVETRWISMRSPAQRIMSEYKILMVKMGLDMPGSSSQKGNSSAAGNFDFLADVEVLLSLACFIPMLNVVHCLIKLTQARDIFICDFMQSIKVCQNELARMFIDPCTAYNTVEFARYNELVKLKSVDIPLEWRPMEGDNGISHLVFNFDITAIFARCNDNVTGNHIFVTQEDYHRVQDNVERQFAEIAQSLCDELDKRFPQQELLDAFGIIYPQYWKQDGADESFPQHLSMLKNFYYHTKLLSAGTAFIDEGNSYTMPEMLSASKLDNQQGLFKVTMKANAEAAYAPPFDVNPVIKLWRNLSQSRHLGSLISEYFKVAEIGYCLVLGSVEDERCFSILKFLKSCQRNRLGKHLPLVVRMFGQKYYSLDNFPYKKAIDLWKNAVKIGRHGDV